MKKWRKVISVLLVFAICLGMLTACGSNDSSDNGKDDVEVNGDEKKQAGDVTKKPDAGANDKVDSGEVIPEKSLPPMTSEKIKLTYCSWENEVLKTHLAQKFMEKYPNITVEVITLPLDGYNDALLNLVSTGQMPDAFWILGE